MYACLTSIRLLHFISHNLDFWHNKFWESLFACKEANKKLSVLTQFYIYKKFVQKCTIVCFLQSCVAALKIFLFFLVNHTSFEFHQAVFHMVLAVLGFGLFVYISPILPGNHSAHRARYELQELRFRLFVRFGVVFAFVGLYQDSCNGNYERFHQLPVNPNPKFYYLPCPSPFRRKCGFAFRCTVMLYCMQLTVPGLHRRCRHVRHVQLAPRCHPGSGHRTRLYSQTTATSVCVCLTSPRRWLTRLKCFPPLWVPCYTCLRR